MYWIFVAIVAQIILGTSAVFDKFLLKRKIFDPWMYTFWIGVFGLVSLVLVPFGFHSLSVPLTLAAFFAGMIFILGLFFLFSALEKGQAGTVLTFVGGLSPLATFAVGKFFLNGTLPWSDLAGFLLLVAGAFIFFLIEKKDFRGAVVINALLSVACFGFYSVAAKVIFEESSFITGFVWMKSGAAFLVLLSLLLPEVRKKIFQVSLARSGSYRAFYAANALYAGIGSVLANFAISLAHPALVDATQSFKYVVAFIAAWFLLHERSRGKILFGKIGATFLIVLGLAWLGIFSYARSIPVDISRPITWGVTFSSKFSKELGVDWQKNFEAILQDLKPKRVRVIAYWNEIEKEKGRFDFTDLDWQLAKMRETKTEAILTLGMRMPRWPECHIPEWARVLSPEEREVALRSYLYVVVERYRAHPEITLWQLENEPFLWFGLCPARGRDFFKKELDAFRNLMPASKVLVSDSGEFGLWYKAAQLGDLFGTTMYRKVYPPSTGFLVGEVEYPLDPSFFRFKEKFFRFLLQDWIKPFIVIELQGEPWGMHEIPALPYPEQISLFSPEYFRDTFRYAKETGFDEYYWWGAEWWYATREKYGDARYWEIAKNIFQK